LNSLKYYKLLVLCAICLGNLIPQTYSISGNVRDAVSNNILDNVNIQVEGSGVGTATDEDGSFILIYENQSNSEINLSFSIIGYDKLSIQLELIDPTIYIGIVELSPKSLQHEPIHVHSHSDKSTQTSDINISGQDLDNNRATNLALTLSHKPNIGVNSFGVTTAKPVLRGYTNKRYIIVRDGNMIGDLSDSAMDHAIAFDMSDVNSIDIVRGPQSLIFGSKAIGGIINTTINGSPKLRVENLYTSFLLGMESYNTGLYGNMHLYFPWKSNQINFSVNSRYTDNQSSPTGTLPNSSSETRNYRIGLTRYNKNNYINFIFENYVMSYGIPPSAEGHINGVDIKLAKQSININFHQDLFLKNYNQLDIKYNYIDYGHQEYENDKDYYAVSLLNNTHDIKVELKSLNLVSGANYSFRDFYPGGFYWTPRTEEIKFSIYNFYEKSYDFFDLLASIRSEYLVINPDENVIFANLENDDIKPKNFQTISSSLGIRKHINKIVISSWIMNTMTAPRIEELYSDGPHLGTYSYEIGEPTLDLEKIYGIESSLEYINKNIHLSLSGFYNYSPYYHQMTKTGDCPEEYVPGVSHPCAGADFIEWGSGASGWLYIYRSEGVRSLIRGAEVTIAYNYRDFDFEYNASLVHGDNLTNEMPLSYINPPKQILTLGYSKEHVNFSARLARGHEQNRLGEFESYTPGYFLVDLISSYKIKKHYVTIQFNNIFDVMYYNHLSLIKEVVPEPGRNIALSYKLVL